MLTYGDATIRRLPRTDPEARIVQVSALTRVRQAQMYSVAHFVSTAHTPGIPAGPPDIFQPPCTLLSGLIPVLHRAPPPLFISSTPRSSYYMAMICLLLSIFHSRPHMPLFPCGMSFALRGVDQFVCSSSGNGSSHWQVRKACASPTSGVARYGHLSARWSEGGSLSRTGYDLRFMICGITQCHTFASRRFFYL